jgi:bacillolysin
MKRDRLKRSLIALAVSTVIAGSLQAAPAAAKGSPTLRIVSGVGTGSPSWVHGINERPAPGSPVDRARRHLAEHIDRYGIEDPAGDLEVLDVTTEGDEVTVRFGQTYNGVEVFGAQYLVHLERGEGGLATESVNGHYFTEIDIDVRPELTEDEAAELAETYTREYEVEQVDRNGLTILPLGDGTLVYHLTLWGRSDDTLVKEDVFINAHTGAEVLRYNSLHGLGPTTGTGVDSHGQEHQIEIFDSEDGFELRDQSRSMYDPETGTGQITTHDAEGSDIYFADDTNVATNDSSTFSDEHSDSGAVDAHHAAGLVYEYLESLGRNSIDGEGMDIVSTVNVGDVGGGPLYNAAWDGQQMIYGNPDPDELYPLSGDLDVVGHELFHGVTESSAGLIYLNQSGAIDEAISDYFGNAIDVDNTPGASTEDPTAGYLGEDLCKVEEPSGWICPFRDLNEGATTDDYVYYLIDFDNGGVHFNSTIFGGALWDIREQLDDDLADRIIFRAVTEYMTPLDDFYDGREAILRAAADLGGAQDMQTIRTIFDDVGITSGWDASTTSDADVLMSDLAPLGFQFSSPSASGDRFVMAGYDDNSRAYYEPENIYLGSTDGSSSPRKISVNRKLTYNHELPDISGGYVVWSHLVAGKRGGLDSDLIFRELGEAARTLVNARGFQWFASIDGDRVAWEDTRSGDTNIWTMTLDGEPERLTNAPGEQLNPQVSGDWVVWIDYGNYKRTPRIQMKNVRTGETRTITPKDGSIISPPSVNSTHVFWYEDRNGDGVGEIRYVTLGSSKVRTLDTGDSPPTWFSAASYTPPAPAVNDEVVVYGDEQNVFQTAGEDVPASEIGRDLWLVPVDGSEEPTKVTDGRGDQSFATLGDGRRVLWLDSSSGKTDLLSRLVP